MKNILTPIFIACLILLNSIQIIAQEERSISNSLWKESQEEAASKYSDHTIKQLTKTITQDINVLKAKAKKLMDLNRALKNSNQALLQNKRAINLQKRAIKGAWKANPTSIRSQSIQLRIDKLKAQTKNLERALAKSLKNKNAAKSTAKSLGKKILNSKKGLGLVGIGGNLVKSTEIVEAGGGTLGEFYAWYEGNSSFKNVVLRATKEGSKAVVSIGTGLAVGALTTAATWNPFAGGAAVVAGTVATEKIFENSIGKYIDYLMDREHDAINKYAVTPEQLEKIREKIWKKLREENKKLMIKVVDKQDELQKYLEERAQAWADIEKESKQREEEWLLLKQGETPIVAQRPSKKKIKPGESVIIDIETRGGLLPIRYSGEISYIIENGYDRNLVAYKWTPDKKMEPGVYEFTIKATSASGKIGRNTIRIEVINPNPAPEPIAKATENYETDTDGERLYSANELNIKEIPGAKIREMIYKVNGIYYGYCETPPDIKTQKFEIELGVDQGNIEGKLGLAILSQFAGRKTIPLSEELIEKFRKKYPYLPEDEIQKTAKVYFHAWGRYLKFDPVSGRIWGELTGESSVYENYMAKGDFKGLLEAKLINGVISGTVSFRMGPNDYSFPFTAKQ